ncbi:helix-turn-helix domain-containing protein [Bythopirellula polymerisocia]|uniref:Uncharacterized protein n=1 Tax=Bythopirellula polymerisocia TaxID=2528003 RepID=A0A5C6D2K4_9BACT|nr:helix-turn-helix transcriptional regulator [Bythopirellula polymerisocia]TWU30084.1 hypothetical protein Pla144_08700 [Bythopirellula polymerisocia]
MTPFGQLLGQLRRRAGLGLRTFAELVDERASTVSAIEHGMRTPWHRQVTLSAVADVLGLVASSPFCEEFFLSARNSFSTKGSATQSTPGVLSWWWTTDRASALDHAAIRELAEFIGARDSSSDDCNANDTASAARELSRYPALTELAAEWRVRKLLGRRESQFVVAPVDVEAVFENQMSVRLEIVPGLIPNFSVQACVVMGSGETTLLVDRIVADSRPLASYRELLARCVAPRALWIEPDQPLPSDWFLSLQQTEDWPQLLRDCERFSLSMLLPAAPVLSAASAAYREVVQQQGWVDTETAACAVRNRLAEQFAVPPLLVHTRLVRWPCHVYGRIAQALAAEELDLPPVEWFVEHEQPQQRLLFEKSLSAPLSP